MKKLIALLLAVVMCLAMAACGEKPAETNPTDGTKPVGEEKADIKDLKIGAFSNSTISDGGYTQAFYRDLTAVAEAYGMSVEDQIVMVENVYDGTPDVASVIQQLITDGCNMIIAHSNGYCDDMAVYAEQYPDIRFYCYEGLSSELVNPYTINNLEVMYLMGYLCAAMSDVDELGFIAPMQNSHIIRSMDAFAIGAKEYNENAKVKVMWVNSWWAPDVDRQCAETLIGEGVKCMAYYGSTATALQACEEGGAFCTGFHIDMHDYAPNACLTSYMWNWQPIITEMVERYLNGNKEISMISGNLSTGCAGMADLNVDLIPEEVAEKVNTMMEKMKNGEIDVLAGPIFDNQGNQVVAEGETIEEKDLTGIMFLVDNVIGKLD